MSSRVIGIICSTQMMSMSSNEFDTKGLSDEEDNDLLDNPYPVFLLTNPATILTDMATVTLLCSSSSVYHPACETHSFFRFQLFFLKDTFNLGLWDAIVPKLCEHQLVTHFTPGMGEVLSVSCLVKLLFCFRSFFVWAFSPPETLQNFIVSGSDFTKM